MQTAAVATPKSPRTPTVGGPAVMVHAINHRFTMTFKMLTVCDFCLKQMFIGKSLNWIATSQSAVSTNLLLWIGLQVSSVRSANINAIGTAKLKFHRLASCLPSTLISFVSALAMVRSIWLAVKRKNVLNLLHGGHTGPQTPIMQRQGGISSTIGSSMMSVPSPSLIRLTPHDKKKSQTQPAIHMHQGEGLVFYAVAYKWLAKWYIDICRRRIVSQFRLKLVPFWFKLDHVKLQ